MMPAPELSIVIPTHDRSALLRACLEGLCAQALDPGRFEVVVVDDGSTDDTAAVLAALETPFALRPLHAPWGGQAVALNRGIEAAAAPICLLLDDDIAAAPELAGEHLRVQQETGGVLGVGRLDLTEVPGLDWFSRRDAAGWRSRYESLANGTRRLSWRDGLSGNLSVPRAALRAVGGFATDLARSYDVELAYRLERHGLRYVYVPAARGRQHYAKRLPDVTRDAERAGAAAVALRDRHPAMLPDLELGGRGDFSERVRRVREALLAARVPVRLLGAPGAVLPDRLQRWWHRFVFSFAYWRGVRGALGRRDWRATTRGVPVLMYHALDPDPGAATRDVLPVARFRAQMRWLRLRRYRVLPLRELLALRREGRLPPPRSVVITFDDGFADVARHAQPVLRGHGFPATVFLVSSAVGGAMGWDAASELTGRPLLAWEEIRRLEAEGTEFGAHTRTHARLKGLAQPALRQELDGCRDDLAAALAHPLPVLAYPFGSYDAGVRSAAQAAGFEAACGVQPGENRPATPSHDLHRISVPGTESLARFAWHLWLGTR